MSHTEGLINEIQECRDAISTLATDCLRCAKQLEADETDQFFRRAFARELCSLLETQIFYMARSSLLVQELVNHAISEKRWDNLAKLHCIVDASLTAAELVALSDIVPAIGDQGELKERAFSTRTLARFRFSATTFIRTHRLSHVIDYSGDGWSALSSTVKLRNRVVHPKSKSDVVVNDADLVQIGTAHTWLTDQRASLTRAAIPTIVKIINAI